MKEKKEEELHLCPLQTYDKPAQTNPPEDAQTPKTRLSLGAPLDKSMEGVTGNRFEGLAGCKSLGFSPPPKFTFFFPEEAFFFSPKA